MPCSGCGGSGHNIRTCGSGPTPGGVSGMRARSSSSYSSSPDFSVSNSRSYAGASSGGYSSYSPAPVYSDLTVYRDQNTTMSRFEDIKADIIKNTDNKFSDVKGLVHAIDSKFKHQLAKVQQKFDAQERMLTVYKNRELDNIDKLLSKMESDSCKNTEKWNKFMDHMDMTKRDTLKQIDVKFKSISDRFAFVDQKTQQNEKEIKKHSQDIGEIKQLLVHIIEKQEKEEVKAKEAKVKVKALPQNDDDGEKGVSDDSDDEEEALMTPDEMMKLSVAMVKAMKKCRNKQDQFQAITALALKYVNHNNEE